jgi:hypothetical protein
MNFRILTWHAGKVDLSSTCQVSQNLKLIIAYRLLLFEIELLV